jgi:hypothetical protein
MAFGPFCLQTPECLQRRFLTLPRSSLDLLPSHAGLGFAFDWQARRSLRPYRVRYPTDESFTSVASHLALQQRSFLRFHAGERMLEVDFHLSDHSRFQAHQSRAAWLAHHRAASVPDAPLGTALEASRECRFITSCDPVILGGRGTLSRQFSKYSVLSQWPSASPKLNTFVFATYH